MTASPFHASAGESADAAFARSLLAQVGHLAKFARKLSTDPASADDLLQDTLMRCWANKAKFEPGSNLAAWSRTVMRNGFFSSQRRARFDAHLSEDAFEELLVVQQTQEWAVEMRDLEWAFSEMSAEHREILWLIGQGSTMEEAAEHLSISTSAVKSRVFRARTRLRLLSEDPAAPLLGARPRREQEAGH